MTRARTLLPCRLRCATTSAARTAACGPFALRGSSSKQDAFDLAESRISGSCRFSSVSCHAASARVFRSELRLCLSARNAQKKRFNERD